MDEQAVFDALKYRIEDTEYGPAVEHANGPKFWYQNGKRHRIGGSAFSGVRVLNGILWA